MPIPLAFLITDLDLGGSPLMLRGLARRLKALGTFEPIVVSLAPLGLVADMIRRDGIEVHSLEARGPRDLTGVIERWVLLMEEIKPAAVMSILIHANVVAALGRRFWGRSVPHAQSIHTLQTNPVWHWWVQGVIGGWADAVVVPAPEILARLDGYGSAQRGVAIPNGVDLERFGAGVALPPTSLPFAPQRAIVGYVGRFDRVKRLETLISAVGWIKESNPLFYNDLQLVLVGYGPEESALRELVLKWGIFAHVTFSGPSTTPERWYKSFSCYCLPSDAEGFGLTLVEAMAAGVPVIAAQTPVSARILGKWGEIVPAGDAHALAIVIQEVIAKRKKDSMYGQVPRVVLEGYSEEAMSTGYHDFFQKFLKL